MELDIEIEKLVYGGPGLARSDGRVVLVPFVLPGERLKVQTTKETPALLQAHALNWQSRSEHRVPAPCPVFERCGGCHYQHVAYPQQLEYKRQILLETLARLGKITWEGPVETVAGEAWAYRNRTQLRIHKRGRHAEVGFLEAGSRRLVAVGGCPINSPTLNRAHQTLLEMARERRFPEFLREIEFFTNETDIQINVRKSDRPLARSFFEWCRERIQGFQPGEFIDYPSGGDLFQVGSRSFFQVNRFLVDQLTPVAIADATGGRALDLYAGVGLLTLPLARRFEQVMAVDSSRRAVRDLQRNAERAGVAVRVVNLNVEDFLAGATETADFVVADPPRAGLGPRVTTELLRLRPPRLVLVSCDPATLARDLCELVTGAYQIDRLTLIDLFPQTFHIETVAQLSLR